MGITVRYYAAACAAAGVESETVDVPEEATLTEVLDIVRTRKQPLLAEVLRRCSFLINEVAAKDPHRRLRDGDVLDVLPPFAGG